MPNSSSKTMKTVIKKNKDVSPCKASVIYMDNNGTTKLCAEGKNAMIKWLDSRANPSSDSIISKKSKELIYCAEKYILHHCKVPSTKYTVLFTSGASESNCLILRSVADSYMTHTGKKPHIITSATEHRSVIQCCNNLKASNKSDITYIEPNAYGCISPDLIEKAITPTTAIIAVMAANNEIGCINNIKKIGAVAKAHKIPFHTDAVQIFGKYRIPMLKNNIDALSMSFHKLYGPMGLGMLIVSNDLINGYGLTGQISGTQQHELRGGTENVPAIAGAIASMKHTFTDRDAKNKKMFLQKKQIIFEIEKVIIQGKYKHYFDKKKPTHNEFLVLGPECNGSYKNPNVLPNTLLLSFVKNVPLEGEIYKPFCNVALKNSLNRKNIIVSIGSACSTHEKKSSHVLYSIKAPDVVKQGTLRVSLSDNTTSKDITSFVVGVIASVKKQMCISR